MKQRNVILVSVAVFVGLCLILSAIGGLAYFLWPQATPTPIVIVATLTPTPAPPVPTSTATPPAQATVPPTTPETVSAPGQPPPSGTILRPIDAAMKAHLRQIMQVGQAKERRINVFAKVGDSITESMAFLFDLGYGWENLGEHTYLSEVVEYYRETTVDTMDGEAHNSFNRQSLCGVSGDCAGAPLEGGPNSTLYQEIEAISPGVAIIMYGTNDITLSDLNTFRADLGRIVSTCEEEGVIPILSTIPDRLDSPEAGALAHEFNAVIRDVAREHNIPS